MPSRAEYPRVFCPKRDFPPSIAAAFSASCIVAVQLLVSVIVFGNLRIDEKYTIILDAIIWAIYFLCILSIKFRWGIVLLWYVVYMVISVFILFLTSFTFMLLVALGMKPPGTYTSTLLWLAAFCFAFFILTLYLTKKTIVALRRMKIVPSLGGYPEFNNPPNSPNRSRQNRRQRESSEVGPVPVDSPPIYIIAVETGENPPMYDHLFPHGAPTTSANLVEAIELQKATNNPVQST
ncbi:unnamed protein product, partial [Mesorhabditis belari]|uniref:MARVEL domain-containing protein n=1 Tax=Mesorhabditis belari TaxID=2138241 RepID=A0AAF3EJC8_9BILA